MAEYKANVCGVRIATWGTDVDGGNGIANFLDIEFFGGNAGHAAVTVTFPADEKGKALIKQYCTEPAIPFEKHLIRVPLAKKGIDPASPKHFSATDEILVEEEVYVVNFSWWPRSSGVGFTIAPFENDDNLDEREGVDVNYDPKWQALLQPEKRVHRGRLGAQKIQYGVDSIIHQASLSKQQIDFFDTNVELQFVKRQLESVKVLVDKLESKKKKLKDIKKRKANLNNKSAAVLKSQQKLQTLEALKNCLKTDDNPFVMLTMEQQTQLDKIYPNWRYQPSISLIESKEKALKKKIKNIARDTPKKVKKSQFQLAKLSSNEKILLDRFIPDWRENIAEQKINPKLIKNLIIKAQEEKSLLKSKKAELETQQTKLEHELLLPNVQDFLLDLKLEMSLKELQTFLAEQKPSLGGLNYFLGEEFTAKMQQFEVLTGVKWRDELARTVLNQFNYLPGDAMQYCRETLAQKIDVVKARNQARLKEDVACRHKFNELRYEAWYEIYDSLWQFVEPRSARYIESEGLYVVHSYIQHELDEAFKFSNKKWYGPEGVIKDRNVMTRAEILVLYAFVRKKMIKAKRQLVDEQESLGIFKQGDFARFLTRGRPPDMEVRLPLNKSLGVSNGVEEGMDVESMLKEMQRITREEKFNIHTNNCSSTVSKILEAGATTPYLKHQFQNRALGVVANPQMVVNNGLDYLSALKKPKDNWFKRLQRFSPFERLGGWCLSKLVLQNDVPKRTRVAAGLLAIPMGIYAIVKATLIKMTNPLDFFKGLVRFANYANKHDHTGFKVAAALAYVPGMLLSAPFAAVQYGMTQAVKGIKALTGRIFGKKKVLRPPEFADLSPAQLKELEHKQAIFNQVSKEMLARIQIVEISANTISDACQQFESKAMEATYAFAKSEIKDDQYTIVTLSKATMKIFENEINRLRKSTSPDLQQQAAELEVKYHSYLKSNQFMISSVNRLIQSAFEDRLSLISKTSGQSEVNSLIDTAVDPVIIYTAAEQARLDAQRNFAQSESATETIKPTDTLGTEGAAVSTKRQRVRQEAFERLKNDASSLSQSQPESTDPEVTTVKDIQPKP